MSDRTNATVLTYNGVDGACAAAMALLQAPGAAIEVTSAARVGDALSDLAARGSSVGHLYVCGLGVFCDEERVLEPAGHLRERGAGITWFCGRGYLDSQREFFSRFCTPVFLDAGSNTEAVCRHFGLGDSEDASALLELARHDPNLDARTGTPTGDQEFWLDLIEAAVADYFKYQDEKSYREVIRKLPRMEYDEADARKVAVFRRAGFKHVLWGKSAAMRRLREEIRRCAEVDEPVLITGESGVGKEYVAHLIHERSRRGMGPFVPVNCGLFAGNASLANSTLFGHLKGAFTGALQNRDGAFMSADSGFLFLDEVGELPLEVQAKFLRVLEDGWVTPVGSDEPQKVDVGVMAATNRDLPAMLREGTFRDDLYHRLDVLQIRVPPLREHIEDAALIAHRILESLDSPESPELSGDELEALADYDWPGNVRQLIKVLKRSVYLERTISDVLQEERRLGASGGEGSPLWPASKDDVSPIREVRDSYAVRALELHGGNLTATARSLDIAVNTLRSYVGD